MRKSPMRVDVGRVIFLPERWIVHALHSHVGNVVQLVEAWDSRRVFQGSIPDLTRTHQQVVEAARIHDIAKPAHFRLEYKHGSMPGKPQWEYSFSGHRFNAFHSDVYVQTLAQLHHEYSVAGIIQHMARLRLNKPTAAIAENLPLDLYILEMCDQIEATVARAVLGSDDPEERVFMDFQFRTRSSAEYEIEPFAFTMIPLRLLVEYIELFPPSERLNAVQTASDDKRKAAMDKLHDWLLSALQTTPLQQKEVRLWPWTE